MTISIRLSDADAALIKNYARLNGISISELVRQSALERIEDEYDLSAFAAALEEHAANPQTYTLDEMERELGLK